MTKDEALKLAMEALEDYKYAEARTIIREALAQPEQEPVQWGVDWGRAGETPCVSIIKRKPNGGIEVVAVEYGPQRTWVGLTDEEREEIALEVPMDAVLITEAKLKEKNCG